MDSATVVAYVKMNMLLRVTEVCPTYVCPSDYDYGPDVKDIDDA